MTGGRTRKLGRLPGRSFVGESGLGCKGWLVKVGASVYLDLDRVSFAPRVGFFRFLTVCFSRGEKKAERSGAHSRPGNGSIEPCVIFKVMYRARLSPKKQSGRRGGREGGMIGVGL